MSPLLVTKHKILHPKFRPENHPEISLGYLATAVESPKCDDCDTVRSLPNDFCSSGLCILVNQHNYGKSQVLMGKLTINGHFQ